MFKLAYSKLCTRFLFLFDDHSELGMGSGALWIFYAAIDVVHPPFGERSRKRALHFYFSWHLGTGAAWCVCARSVPWLIELKQAQPGNMQVRVHVAQASPLAGTRAGLADAALYMAVRFMSCHALPPGVQQCSGRGRGRLSAAATQHRSGAPPWMPNDKTCAD